MRGSLIALSLALGLTAGNARAQCQDGGSPAPDGGGGCTPAFTVTVAPLPQITGAPLLEIDAVVQDDGSIIGRGGLAGGTVYVTVRGTGAGGGGTIIAADGGLETLNVPLDAGLTLGPYTVDGGVFTSLWDGGTSLFLGDNTITVTAVQPTGNQVTSAPQVVRLDLAFDAGSPDAGVDGGTGSDGGTGTDAGATADGGTSPDGGATNDAGQSSPDAGTSGGSASTSTGESQGCSTTASSPPSFFLMALAVMLAGLGRRAMRG